MRACLSPETKKPGIITEVSIISKKLVINENNPKVSNETGKCNMIRKGLSNVVTKAMATAAATAVKNESGVMPGKIYTVTSTTNVEISNRRGKIILIGSL